MAEWAVGFLFSPKVWGCSCWLVWQYFEGPVQMLALVSALSAAAASPGRIYGEI